MAKKTISHSSHLIAGMPAPWFEGIDQYGELINLNTFKNGLLLLYFYPKNGTGPCNAQACNLRDNFDVLRERNIEIVGVSTNNKITHSKFTAQHQLPFRLIEDKDLMILKAYNVWGQKKIAGNVFEGIIRTSFLIESGLIKAVIKKVDTQGHSQQILEIIA